MMMTPSFSERCVMQSKGATMEKNNGSGDLPEILEDSWGEPQKEMMTPGEKAILNRMGQMEARIQGLESSPQEDRLGSIHADEPVQEPLEGSGRCLMEQEDGFLYVAEQDYTGSICTVCHMPPIQGCRSGVFGLDPGTKRLQLDPVGHAGSFLACKQKVEWRSDWEPRQVFSGFENGLPEPGKVKSLISESAKEP